MLTQYFPDPHALRRVQATPATPYLDGFAAALEEAGYALRTLQGHLRAAAHLGRWQQCRGQSLSELDERSIAEFKHHLQACRCDGIERTYLYHTAGAKRFVQYLRDSAVIPATDPTLDATTPPLLVGFCDWMRQHRGVTDTTLDSYSRIIVDALETLGDNPQQYEVADLRAFVLDRANRHGRSKAKLVVTALRAFLRYLIAQGQCRSGLDMAIPTIAGWRLSALPRYISAAEVERLIAGCDPTSVAGARDRAILLLLVRLGLRGGEVATLQLDDIDWEQATIQVTGKSRRPTQLPLPQEVGDAVLYYLEHARPATETDQVFLRVETPVGPFASGCAVSNIVKRAIHRAGISAPTHGAHLLRHSAATALLAEGASLDSIGVLLRHQSLDTTTIYAKVDINRLRKLALPWPEIELC